MRTEDLHLISKLGRALYANPAQAESRSFETVAAISTLPEISEDLFLERALALMLHQAERDGSKSGVAGVANPFFRLSPKERFVLFLLHSGRASYKRLARLLATDVDEVQTVAWIARTQIASSPEIRMQAPHPTGSSRLKQSCPEFNTNHPWTQKFLDDEMGNSELAFLQNHTTICEDCRRALHRTREFYYTVEKWIPVVDGDANVIGTSLLQAIRKGQLKAGQLPTDLTLREALGLFFMKRENLVWVFLFVAALVTLIVAKKYV